MEPNLRQLIQDAINRTSAESASDTPDFILAEYLTDCLAAYDKAVKARENWYGRRCGIGTSINVSKLEVASKYEAGVPGYRDGDGGPLP